MDFLHELVLGYIKSEERKLRSRSSLRVSSLLEQVPMPFKTDVFLLSYQLGIAVIFSS